MNVAGQLSECCSSVSVAGQLLQGSSVNVAGQLSDCCRAAQ